MELESSTEPKEESSILKNSIGISNFHMDILEDLNEFRLREEFCDLQLKIGDRIFPCHRCVLASASNYFYALLGPNYKEHDQSVIELPNIDAVIFEHILNFMYGKLLNVGDDIVNLLFAISYLQLKRGDEIYEDIIKNRIQIKDALKLFSWPDLKFKTDLYNYVRKYICINFSRFQELDEVYQLSFEAIKEVLMSPDLLIFNENDVLHFVTKWICYDFEERLKFTEQVIKFVSSRLVLPGCFYDLLSGLKDTGEKENYLKILLNGLLPTGNSFKTTIPIDSHPLLFFYKPEEVVLLLESKNTRELPLSFKWFDDLEGAVHDKNIFISCSKPYKNEELPFIKAGYSFYGCNADTRIWEPLHPTGSISKDLVVCNATLYSYQNSWNNCNFYSYQPHFDRWFAAPTMKVPRENAGITSDSCSLYVIGGKSSATSQRLYTMEMYDVRCKSWMDLGTLTDDMKALKNVQYRKKVIIVDGNLYVIVDKSRGFNNSDRCFYLNSFDMRTSRWHISGPMEMVGDDDVDDEELVALRPEFVFSHRRNDVKVIREDWNISSYYTYNKMWTREPVPIDWYYDSDTVCPIKPIFKPLC